MTDSPDNHTDSRSRLSGQLTAAAAYLAALLLLLWSRGHAAGYAYAAIAALSLAVAGFALHTLGAHARRNRIRPLDAAALLLLAAACMAALRTDRRMNDVAQGWEAKVGARGAALSQALDTETRALFERGQRVATLAAEATRVTRGRQLFLELASLRARSDVAALAIFDPTGQLIAWSGEHHGRLPAQVAANTGPIVFVERPLFSYLYLSVPADERGVRATAAILLESGWPAEHFHDRGFAGRFQHRHGGQPRFTAAAGAASWSYVVGADTVLRAQFEPVTQAEWRRQTARQGTRWVALLTLAAALLLALARTFSPGTSKVHRRSEPLLVLAVALALVPLGPMTGGRPIFSPALFLLPGPLEVTLGTFMLALLPIAALVASRRPPFFSAVKPALLIAAGALVVGLGYAGAIELLLRSAGSPLLLGGFMMWGPFHMSAVVLLALIAVLLFPSQGTESRRRTIFLISGLALSTLLSLAFLARWSPLSGDGRWTAVLWAVPYVFIAIGVAPLTGKASLLLRWLCAGWLAASAVVPQVWVAHTEARLRAGERDLATLGTQADPYVEYLLRRFAEDVTRRAARGESGQELLYRSWLGSGLASEALPVEISLLAPDGAPLQILELGDTPSATEPLTPPWVAAWLHGRALQQDGPVLEATQNAPGANQVMAVRIAGDRVVLAVVPPRRTLQHSSLLAPLLGDEPHGNRELTLVPVRSVRESLPRDVVWQVSESGWRSETFVPFPDGDRHAHLEIRVPPMGVRLARAALLFVLDLLLLAVIWLVGRAARGDVPRFHWRWLRSFRSRVTLTLFGFFLLPTIVFGLVAYRSLAGEVARSSRVMAERMVAQANLAFPDSASDMEQLAARVGGDVLYYQGGELLAASSPEANELGLYDAWLPPSVFLALRNGEVTTVSQVRDLGRHPYLFAYGRVEPSGMLAVPVSLEVGEAATRQQELAHLILFAVIIGALLSLALSVIVGRALADPIGQLRRAASLVGAGRLNMRLPENRLDEFGELFRSFNRMARRLRRARAREARTARVLAWGEMARQVAHEIKNPLTPIKLSVQHLRRAYADRHPNFGEVLESNVDEILVEIDRLSDIARAFSRFGAPAEAAGPLEKVRVPQVAHEALTLYRASEERIHYEELVDADVPDVIARSGELKEVLLNLLENARTAVEGAGAIAVTVGMREGAVELAVSDNGSGIRADLLARIFEPQFSTRSTGTGLGLAIVRRLVESWGGSVTAESAPGQGTTVRVRMRVADDARPA